MKVKMCKMPAEYAEQPNTTITLEMPVELFKKVKDKPSTVQSGRNNGD